MNVDGWAAPDTPAAASAPVVPPIEDAPHAPAPRAVVVHPVTPGAPPAPVPLRPLRLVDVLDGAFTVLKVRPRTVIGVTAIFVLPMQVLIAYVSRHQLGDAFDVTASFQDALQNTGAGPMDLVFAYVGELPLLLVAGVLGHLVAAWYAGVDPGIRSLLRTLGPRLPALLGTWVVIHLAETVALATCIGPLFLWPLVLVCAPAIGAEQLGFRAALRRSFRLGARRYWSFFWIAICSGIIAEIVAVSLGVLPSFLADVLGPTWGWLVLAAGNTAAALVTVPFVAAASTLAYLDARMRTEALDLELRAVEILGSA